MGPSFPYLSQACSASPPWRLFLSFPAPLCTLQEGLQATSLLQASASFPLLCLHIPLFGGQAASFPRAGGQDKPQTTGHGGAFLEGTPSSYGIFEFPSNNCLAASQPRPQLPGALAREVSSPGILSVTLWEPRGKPGIPVPSPWKLLVTSAVSSLCLHPLGLPLPPPGQAEQQLGEQ